MSIYYIIEQGVQRKEKMCSIYLGGKQSDTLTQNTGQAWTQPVIATCLLQLQEKEMGTVAGC